MPAGDTKPLKNQLNLVNPAPPGNPSGWTIVPRFSMQEAITDNVLEVKAPRRFDVTTLIAPGISIQAETSIVSLNLDYQPNIYLHAITGPLNAVTQQLNLTGLITVVPDLAFVDVRGTSGVQSRFTGAGGTGTLGAGGSALSSASSSGIGTGGGLAGSGLNRNNQVQTTSYGLSPYLLRRFGEYGTGKVGVSVNASRSASLSGLTISPLPSGGVNGQSLLTTEQIANFTTGEFLGRLQATVSLNTSQTSSASDLQQVTSTTGRQTIPRNQFSSRRQTYNVDLSYALNRTFTLLASAGEQSIEYSQNSVRPIKGLTWNVGTTITPNPDTTVTLKYGHQNGSDTLTASAHYGLSGRTSVGLDYTSTVGTQLENLQNQLNRGIVDSRGNLVTAVNGVNGLIFLNSLGGGGGGVFRYNTLNVTTNSVWLRDTITTNLTWSIQTSLSNGAAQLIPVALGSDGNFIYSVLPAGSGGQSTDIKSASVTWTHDLAPDLAFSGSGSYSFSRRNGSQGNDGTLSAAAGLQYSLSDNSTVSARYSFFDRISHIQGYSIFENLLILGFTKKF